MDIKNFALSFYKNALDGFHIQRLEKSVEAKNLHTHEYYQIYYVERGKVVHYIQNFSSDMVAGDMFIIPPGVNHRILEGKDSAFYSVSFTEDMVQTNTFVHGFLSGLNREERIKPKVSLPADEAVIIEEIIKQIYKEFGEKKIAHTEVLKAYLTVLLARFARIWYEDFSQDVLMNSDSKRFILYCVSYVEDNCFQDITLDSVVKLSAMSRSRFCKMFFETTGYTFNRYLNVCRIRRAAGYIKDGYNITVVCGLCGYNDFSTFNRNFKKIMGTSPALYKKSITK